MSKNNISASQLKKRIEIKAYAYGVSSVVSTLLGEYVVELLRDAAGLTQPAQEYEQ